MPANTSALDAALAALTTQVAETETVEASAVTLINGFAASVTAAVTAALEADNAADQTSIDAATAAIEATRARFAASEDALGAAIVASTPSA
jgi:hypothetical protein